MIPFFVVDRPISLEIIKDVSIPKDKKIGLMAHANTSPNFRQKFREYPEENTIKMCDSAIFHPQRDKNTYRELFDKYVEMGADYGIIIDVLQDSQATLKSAKEALEIYSSDVKYSTFKLVGVAQGKNENEFLECYAKLKELGFDYIAVGGLLKRYESSARYIRVRDEALMENILKKIKDRYNPDWLFVLGCFNPSRIKLFKELNVWGDYKGWIFEYKKRDEAIKKTIHKFRNNHLNHTTEGFSNSQIYTKLVNKIEKRELQFNTIVSQHKKLLVAKKGVKDFIYGIYDKTKSIDELKSNNLLKLRTRAYLEKKDQDLVYEAINCTSTPDLFKAEFKKLLADARSKKNTYDNSVKNLGNINKSLLKMLNQVKATESVDIETQICASEITQILALTEQDFRIKQVQTFIEEKILKVI